MEIEVNYFLHRLFYGVTLARLVEIPKTIAVVHTRHLSLCVNPFLSRAQYRIADVTGNDFNPPGWRNERFRRRHYAARGIAQIEIGEAICNQHG